MKKVSKNKTYLIIILCFVLLLMGIGFAAFSQVLTINETSKVTNNWDIYISKAEVKEKTGSGSGTANIDNKTTVTLSPSFINKGDSVTYNVTVTNGGNVDAILETLSIGDYDTSTITLTVDGIAEGDTLTQSESKTFTVKVKYNENAGTLTQATGEIKLDLNFVQGSGPSGGSGSGESAASMLIAKAVTSGDGLYADTYEAGRYVYKGGNPNNYIVLDGATYRIVAVEADNIIKVVKQYNIGCMAWDASGNRTKTGYCSSNYCNAWGSNSTTLNSSGNNVTAMPREAGSSTTYALPSNEASLNTYLNGTFLNGLSTELKSKISSHTFNVGPLARKSGQTLETDISQESAYKWRGRIGLISATDYVRASTNSACTSAYEYSATSDCYNNSDTHNYLFHSVDAWTMSPDSYSSSSTVWFVSSGGFIGNNLAYGSGRGVWPSFYLTSDIILSGEGTSNEPYCIEGVNCEVLGNETNVGNCTGGGGSSGGSG